MSSNPNNFLDGTLVGIVVGGDINDPAPDQSCNMKVFIPGLHGKDVKLDHLGFSTMMKSPTKGSQTTFEGVLDPGSLVFVRKDTGSPVCHIIGTANDIYDPESRTPGNIDLVHSIPFIADIMRKTINVRIPPNIQEVVENGVKIRKIIEKNKYHSHNLTAGIPSNGAIYPLGGTVLPSVKGVPTAAQATQNILTAAVATALPGVAMSLGGILNMITGTIARELFSKMPPQAVAAFNSMSMLVQSIESTNIGSFMTGARVDPATLLANTVKLLAQTTNISDVVSVFQRIQYDTSLYGIDKLASTIIKTVTPFGIIQQSIDASGNITNIIPKAVEEAAKAFGNLMSNPAAFAGVNPGQNLFGASASSMFNMFGRLAGAAQQTAIDMSNKLNQSDKAQKFTEVAKKTNGDNPFSLFS